MTKRVLPSALENALINNEPFDYAHLIKFERPFNPFQGEFRENENRFVYLTDGARDIEYKGDTYNAHQLLTVGNYSETTKAKATNMNITVPGEYLGLKINLNGVLSANNSTRDIDDTCTLTSTSTVVDGLPFSWTESGFKIGDKISIKKQNGTLFSGGTDAGSISRDAVSEKIFIISGLNDTVLTLKQTGINPDDSSFLVSALTSPFTVGLLNEEIFGATLDKGTESFVNSAVTNTNQITLQSANTKIKLGQLVSGAGIEIDSVVTSITGTTLKLSKTQASILDGTKLIFTNPSFINRKVDVFKVFLNPDTGAIIGDAILTFRGFITSTNIQETPTSSKVQWNMTSHWGDFSEVSGRISSDEIHRALDSNGKPQKLLAIKPQYASDLGFLHSDISLNTVATYQTSETRYRNKTKRRGGVAGLFGGKKSYVEEYQEEIDHDVDLSVYLQGKYLPVVYGVMRVPGIPIFADTLKNDPNSIYVAYGLSEGEIQGIYNLYIDSNSLLCVDAQDATARTGSDATALTCYGRMDRGGTLSGTNINSSGTVSFEAWLDEEGLTDEYKNAYSDAAEEDYVSLYDDYVAVNEANIPEASVTDDLQGLGHEESASISSPHNMDFTFYSGRPFQKTSNILASVAAGDNFKRQDSYYTGLERYWSPDHTLLDTAYAVAKFNIDADSTTVPEVEYVVKGKALHCFNYDGTFVSDPVYQAATQSEYGGEADSAVNFKEGDIISVETSYNGTAWQAETGFRILHKYTDVDSRGVDQVRFILDKQPNLALNSVTEIEVTNSGSGYTSAPTVSVSGGSGSGATIVAATKRRRGGIAGLFGKRKTVTGIENGKIKNLFIVNPGSGYTSAPTISISGGGGSGATAVAKTSEYGVPQRKFVRLKSSSNKYWHMLPYNSNVQDTPLNILNDNKIDITNAVTDSNGILTLTLTSAAKTKFLQLYPNVAASSAYSEAHIKIGGTLPNVLKSVKDKTMLVNGLSGSSTNLAISNYRFTPNQSNLHTNITIMPSDAFFINSTHEFRGSPHATLTSNELIGSFFEVMETEEIRKITSVDTSNNIIRLEAPLIFTPTITSTTNNNDTYVIQGKGLDKRSSINPAIQTTDLLIDSRYGKGLDIEEDIDIASVREAALLCDTRADVTVSLASAGNVTAGDIYKLSYSSNHVASGEVVTTASSTTSVTFTNVSGKFLRPFGQHILYSPGDIILRQASGATPYYYQYTGSGGYENTEPTHTSGASGNWTIITSISLTKVSGSGSSTLAMSVSGNGVGYSLYDSDFVKYWRYIGWVNSQQFNVTRHQTNFYIDTSKPLFDNVNAILSHYNGILSYSNGKYVMSVETQEATPTLSLTDGIQTNPEYIDNSDIIGTISLSDNSLKTSKNTIKASLNDPQNHFNSRSVSFFNADFLKSDRGIVKTGSFPFTGITSYYNARVNVEKELIQSRYSKEISFTIGPKGLLLKPGEVIAFNYEPFGFESKLFRIENLTYNSNCTTSVKAREYDDSIYAITQQRATLAHRATTGLGQEFAVPSKPTSLSTSNNKPGIVTLNWTNGTGFKEATDSTEIWRASSQGSSGTIPNHAQLQAVVDNVTVFNDALGTAGTFYYWIRHRRNAKSTSSQAIRVIHSEFNTAIGAGTTALALVPSPQLDVDISSAQVRFNSSNVLTPSGTSQDVLLTATLRNITASNVTFTLVNSDTTTTASDVTFTNNNASVVDSSAPFTATIDASSFAHDTTNKFVKVTTTDSNSNESFSELIPVTVSKDGSSGSIGSDAKAIKLTPSSHVISYSAVGGESTTISFTTETQGFSGTKFYQFLVGGAVKQASTTATFTLADSDEPAANATTNVVVKLYDTDASGSALAQDTVTIFGVKDGSDGVTAFLTNNSHTVATASDGTGGSFTNAGGTFKVFVGSTDITTATSGGQEVTYAVNSETGVDVAINSTTGVYTVASMSADQGAAVFRATIPANLSPDGTQFTLDQTYSISKSKTGNVGAAGSNAKTVQLTSNEYAINYDKDGALVTGQGTGSSGSEVLTLSADAKNFSDARFQYLENGSQIQAFTTSSTETVTIPQTSFTTPKVYQVNVKEDGESVEASDSLSVFAVREGTDGHTVFLTNPTHAFPATSTGTVAGSEFAAGATEFRVFRGSTQLTFNSSGGGAGTNTYTVNGSPTLSGMTGDFTTVSNQRKFTPTALSADSGSATFVITAGGNTFTQTYTYAKSKGGAPGTDGDDGTDSFSGLLTNENASATYYGGIGLNVYSAVNYTSTGGEFKVFEGASEKTSGVVYSITGGSSSGGSTTKTQNGLTLTINQSTGVYIASGTSWTTEKEEFTLTGTAGSTVITKVYNIDKKFAFTTTELTASAQTFSYDKDSTNPSPSTITLTASVPSPYTFFSSYSYQYQFSKSTDNGANFSVVQSWSTTRTLSVSAGAFSLGNEVFKVEVRTTYLNTYVLDSDEQTLIRIKEGATGTPGAPGDDGDDGASNFTIFQESANPPATPSAGTSNPPTSSWYSTVTAARNAVSGNGLVWFSVGTKPGTSTTITWSEPIKYVEDYDHIGGTKPPSDANKFAVQADSTEGRATFVTNGTAATYDVFSSTERTKLDNLRAGTLPGGSGTIESTLGSQTRVNDRLSSTEKNRLNAGTSPDNTKSFDNAGTITGNLTGTVGGVANSTIRSGAAAGATANQDSTGTILAGTHTGDVSGTIGGVANSTIRGGVSRANSAIDSSNRIIGSIYDGSNSFSPTELLRVRDGFDNIGSGNLTLKTANLPTVPVNKGGTGVSDSTLFLNSELDATDITDAGGVDATSLAYGEIASSSGSTATSWSYNGTSYTPTATTQTITLTIAHPTFGTSTVVGTWTRTNFQITNFSLGTGSGMSGSGTNNWTFGDVDSDSGSSDNAFGSSTANYGTKTLYVQHSSSNKRVEITAFVLNFNFGGGGKCLTPAMLPKNLQIGDEIDSPQGKTKVIDIQYKEREGYYILEDELEITNDHPILIDGEWILAEEYAGKKEYIDKPTEVVYVETENELLTVKDWTVGGKY